MDLSSSPRIAKVDSSTYHNDPNETLILVNVLLVDATSPQSSPAAFQLHHDSFYTEGELTATPAQNSSIRYDSFISLGRIEALKKRSHIAILENSTKVHYRYLIVVGGSSNETENHESNHERFFSAVISLIDAMRMRNKIKIPDRLMAIMEPPLRDSTKTMTHPLENLKDPNTLQKLFSVQLGKNLVGKLLSQQASPKMRLFELQL